jgi:hypothetical protein
MLPVELFTGAEVRLDDLVLTPTTAVLLLGRHHGFQV